MRIEWVEEIYDNSKVDFNVGIFETIQILIDRQARGITMNQVFDVMSNGTITFLTTFESAILEEWWK